MDLRDEWDVSRPGLDLSRNLQNEIPLTALKSRRTVFPYLRLNKSKLNIFQKRRRICCQTTSPCVEVEIPSSKKPNFA